MLAVNLGQTQALNTPTDTRNGELRAQNLKYHPLIRRSLKVFPLKPGVGQCIALYATLTARDSSSLISTLPVHSPAFFRKTAASNTASCVGPQNKIGHRAGCRFPC